MMLIIVLIYGLLAVLSAYQHSHMINRLSSKLYSKQLKIGIEVTNTANSSDNQKDSESNDQRIIEENICNKINEITVNKIKQEQYECTLNHYNESIYSIENLIDSITDDRNHNTRYCLDNIVKAKKYLNSFDKPIIEKDLQQYFESKLILNWMENMLNKYKEVDIHMYQKDHNK